MTLEEFMSVVISGSIGGAFGMIIWYGIASIFNK